MIQTMISGAAVVLGFGMVIFFHEMGHFLVAKKMNMKVDRFSFGLGPEAIGFQWGETRYCIALIPLGGEVRLAGEMPGEETNPELLNDPRAFFVQPWYRRIPVVLAGPAMNYVLSSIIFAFVIGFWGEPTISQKPLIGSVISGMPAAAAGLQDGDLILTMNGNPVTSWDQAAQVIRLHPSQAMTVQIQRGADNKTIQLTPEGDANRNGVGIVGITPKTEFIKVPASQALTKGVQQSFYWSMFTLRYLKDKIAHHEKPDISGPLGIAQVVAKAAHAGWQDLLFLIGMISVGVGLFNLFPIPMLDGGHMAFYLIEGIFRKPLSSKSIQFANAVGFSLLMAILLFATYNDIERLRAEHAASDASTATKTP